MAWILFIHQIIEWPLRLILVLVVLHRKFLPSRALAWLALIFLLPELGLLQYLLIGSRRLGKKRVKIHRSILTSMRADPRRAGLKEFVTRPEFELMHKPLILQAEQIGGMPILSGNSVELLPDSPKVIDRLIADIDAACNHVHLLFYIFATDATARRVSDAVVRACKRGVRCRVLADHGGSRPFFSRRKGLCREMTAAGAEVHPMLPVSLFRLTLARIDLRNHRKLAVIDGAIAYTGSQNIVDENYGRRGQKWIDLMGRFTGPVVAQLQMVFMEDWAFETGQTLNDADIMPRLSSTGNIIAQAVPSGPSDDDSESLPRVLITAINAAQRKIIITSPYLVPDESTILAMAMAVDRGVEVNLIVPSGSDHLLVEAAGRAYYEPLMDGGIAVFRHKGLIHSKTMTVDDSFALLGSANMDIRSFYLNFELSVLMYGPEITAQLRFAQQRYLSESTRIQPEVWCRRPIIPRYLDRAAALLSPLL